MEAPLVFGFWEVTFLLYAGCTGRFPELLPRYIKPLLRPRILEQGTQSFLNQQVSLSSSPRLRIASCLQEEEAEAGNSASRREEVSIQLSDY